MDSSYGHHYDASDMNRGGKPSPHDDPMSGMSPDFGDGSMYGDNRMFDPNPQRHGSLQTATQGPMSPSQYSHSQHNPATLQRRQSMPEFNGANGARMSGNLQDFQFNPSTGAQAIMIPGMLQTGENGQGRPMNLITQYISGTGQPFQTMISPVQATFANAQQMNVGNNQQMNMNNMNMQSMQNISMMDMSQMNHQNSNNRNSMGKGMQQFIPNNNMMPSVMLQVPQIGMPNNQSNSPQDHGSQHDNTQQASPINPSPLHQTPQDQMSSMSLNTPTQLRPQGSYHSQNSMSPMPNMGRDGMSFTPQTRSQFPLRQDQQNFMMQNPGGQQSMDTMTVRPSTHQGNYLNAYSSTGFDMLNVLVRVATRPDPEINIGAVDLSCAFVVCDALEHDFPIIYCSENFERLTGYTKHEILGRNCRFLQAPDGKVRAGVKRSYVDDESVLYLKNRITERKEAQVSIINYRKGGQPFMNLLTMIPVSFDDGDVRYFVGFQVDLVEQPSSVTNKNKDGTYTVNYQRGLNMPRYVYQGAENVPQLESGQTVSRDDVSTVLTTIGSGESDLSRRIWDKVLLENTDDVVFVLSLKGLFLYLSPSSKRILEYEPQQLVGTALSSVCHPSDIVPVTRELKDTSNSTTVNVVFRIRRRESGYMWFEGYGSLHTEQGKGRKSIVLVGRERPVYSVSVADIQASGGIGENEVWTKLSTSGMFLFVSSSIRALVDKTPEELVGTSIQALMRTESRKEFSRVLEVARGGRRASAKHELLNKRGQVLQAVSTVYPGDATEGSKPTFFVAQTRLVKYSRPSGSGSQRSSQPIAKVERESTGSMAGKSASPAGSGGHNSRSISGGLSSHASLPSPARFLSGHEHATTYAGGDGLTLGHQDQALASELNLFDELKTTRSTSWQFELRQMEKRNRLLAEELQGLLAARKKRKRRKGAGMVERDCANCHTKVTPEWRRGPSGNRDLCNSCGLRWAKQQGRISPRTSSQRSTHSDGKQSGSPLNNSNVHGANTGSNNNNDRRKSRSIDETLAETSQPLGSDGSNIGDSAHVSKSAKIGGVGDSNSIATKVENSQDDSAS